MSDGVQAFEYVGFWARAIATLIDTLVLVVVTWPMLLMVYDVNTPITTAAMANRVVDFHLFGAAAVFEEDLHSISDRAFLRFQVFF